VHPPKERIEMIINNCDKVVIIDSVIDEARDLWEFCPDDFCIQYVSCNVIVFGSTNRVVWNIKNGFRIDTSFCTEKFIINFNKKMGRCKSKTKWEYLNQKAI